MAPIVLTLPIRIESVGNLREHWAKKAARASDHRGVAKLALWQPCAEIRTVLHTEAFSVARQSQKTFRRWRVKLVRIAPRALDSHDNLRSGCKASADGIADALGVNDRDPRVSWEYDQERGKVRQYALRLEIEERL